MRGILRARELISIRCGNFLWSAPHEGGIIEDVYATGRVWQVIEESDIKYDAVSLSIYRGPYIKNLPLFKFPILRSEFMKWPTYYTWRYITDDPEG